MELIKQTLIKKKEVYLQDFDMVMSKLNEVQENPLIILTELYDVVRHSEIDTYTIFTTEWQNNVCIPLLQTLDIFKGFTLTSKSCFVFTVYDAKQEFSICTFDIRSKCYFGEMREPVNYNKLHKEVSVSKETLNCANEYINKPSLINKYRLLKSDFKSKKLLRIIKNCLLIDKTSMIKACKALQFRERTKDGLFETQEAEYMVALERYEENKDRVNQLYEWLKNLGYYKA